MQYIKERSFSLCLQIEQNSLLHLNQVDFHFLIDSYNVGKLNTAQGYDKRGKKYPVDACSYHVIFIFMDVDIFYSLYQLANVVIFI